MKLKQLFEVKYAGRNRPQYVNLSAEKVVSMFFVYNEDLTQEFIDDVPGFHDEKFFTPKDGLTVQYVRGDDHHDLGPYVDLFLAKDGWHVLDNGDEYPTDPSEMIIHTTAPLYAKR